jgi:putative DNA primase/helicase
MPILFMAGTLLGWVLMHESSYFDFNDAADHFTGAIDDVEALRQALNDRLESVLLFLFPQGRVRGGKFYVGDIDGSPGKSLVVEMEGPRRGLWFDFATDMGGDVFDAWGLSRSLSVKSDFPRILEEVRQWCGVAPPIHAIPRRESRAQPVDELGPYTAIWDYQSAAGELIARVYRYDPPSGKEFRPWDVRARMWRAPDPRPLYNQPAMVSTRRVVLAEGEKCAQALIEHGIVATTAMNGARAPIDKTDWSPLHGKDVLIWPDRDPPGWDYAEAAAKACVAVGCRSVAIVIPPQDKPEKWDAADAIEEGFDCNCFLESGDRITVKASAAVLPAFSMGEMLDDDTPLPDDLVSDRIITPGGVTVFGGAPKVGKSDYLLSWLAHMAAGLPFLEMVPARALKVFYLQAEVQYPYLKERVKGIRLTGEALALARRNLVVTPQLHLILDEEGVEQLVQTIGAQFGGVPPDIIAIDPIRNVFDGGGTGGENDNDAMMFFLTRRVSRLQQRINPDAGVMLVHHTKKMSKRQFEEDPFQAFAGASSLRGFHSSALVLHRPDESSTVRQLFFELRNGPGLSPRYVDKINGQWEIVNASERLVLKEYGQRLDAERLRKLDVILQILLDEGLKGNSYTANQFAEAFEGKAGLGGERTIRERLSALATQGYIKYFRNAADYGLPSIGRSKFGYLCVEHMVLNAPQGDPDPDTGEVSFVSLRVLPTHYKCPLSGAAMPVENPEVWVYPENSNDPQESE